MKQIGIERRFRILWILLLSLVYLTFPVVLAQAAPATGPATARSRAPATAPTSAPAVAATTQPDPAVVQAQAEKLREEGFKEAMGGRFATALERLHRAEDLAPDRVGAAAIRLIEDYLTHKRKADDERAQEYVEAVSRVRRSMLALEHLPWLSEAEIEKDLRKQVLEVASAYSHAGDSGALALASAEEAGELKSAATELLDTAADTLTEARKLLDEDRSEYADAFREISRKLYDNLCEYRTIWASTDTAVSKGRLEGASRLRGLEEKISGAVADLEVMIIAKPWRVGLAQARLAKELAADESEVAAKDWYQSITAIVIAQGEEAIDEARWYDALRAYAGLRDLEPDNETYKVKLKATRKHARALGLYGEQEPSDDDPNAERGAFESPVPRNDDEKASPATMEAETKPAETRPAESESITWRELVAGADPETVRVAISKLHQFYVVAVDYRKVALGALESIRILAETPQASRSFPTLADEERRKEFIEAIDAIGEGIRKRARLDHMDVVMALNGVVSASERTVDIPEEVLSVEFAEGMLDELDKFSSIIWPFDVPDFRKQTMGRFFGVGIHITKERGAPLKVVSPLPGTPAYRQGVKAGDTIVAVDGKRTENLNIDKLVRMITGKKGTRVILSIKRPGMLEPKDFAIIRDEIRIRTVKGWRRKLPDGEWDFMIDPDANIAYIRVTQFTDQTVRDIADVLSRLGEAGVQSLVLDVRLNPGGLLRSATDVADEFIRSGLLVSTKGRPTRPAEVNARPTGKYLNGDLVVLVNRLSASASEIVSGAIKDWRRGIIVGERTFGKGSVQNVIPISEGRFAVLKLTTAYYYLPSGRLLHREDESKVWGVDPDVEILQTPKQMKRWLDIRRKTDLIQDADPDQLTSDLVEQFDADLQLNTAVLLLKLMRLHESKSAV